MDRVVGVMKAYTTRVGDPSTKIPSASPPVPPSTAAHTSNAVSGAAIVQTALRYLGYPYSATGNSPSTGFSCIGFASFVYRQNGIALPGDLQDALNYAPVVPFSQLQPGDLLYFKNTIWNGLSHVAIYIGGGRFVHAEWYGYGVRISSFNNDPRDGNYWIAHYMTANRPWGGAAVAPVVGSTTTTPPAPTTTANKVVGGKQAVVTASGGLNVRTGPSKSSGVVTVAPQGTSVTIIAKSNGWYQVQLPDGTQGWVKVTGPNGATYVSTGGSVAAPATSTTVNPNVGNPTAPTRSDQPTSTTAAVHTQHATTTSQASGLRVHTAPSVNAPVVTSLAAGERVTVLSRQRGWMKIRTSSGQVGWVMASYTSGPSRATSSGRSYNSYSYHSSAKRAARTTTRPTITGGSRVTAGVRLHAGPSLTARVIGGVAAGARVQVLGRVGSWLRVRTATGQIGYVYGAYVR
jgi:uncharacterized protein YgiM (DUF1202 family)